MQENGQLEDWRVTKSNDLISANYTLTLNEQRLILLCIAQVDSRKINSRIRAITAVEFSSLYGIEQRHAYEALEEAAERLWNREVVVYLENGCVEKIRWVSKSKYDKGNGRVTINFSPEIIPLLTLLNERFTSYELRYIAKLSSTYAIRIYEYLKQYARMRETVKVDLLDFKSMLELSDSYARFSNLKARILQPAIDQINEHTDLDVEWEPIREKRSVVALSFRFLQVDNKLLDDSIV